MAGKIEEPFRFNFQADLLHSGSISFGRFESESLSWEKRSSFSHNRYLEEVEKYSKPGSVTEKKAYFEAHFRRKALLKQSSSECQDGREFQTSENDDPQDLQESENGNESKYFTCFDKHPHSSGHSKYDEETDIQKCEKEKIESVWDENNNTSSHVTNFDESYPNLGHEGCEILECERAELGVFSVASTDGSIINIVDHMVSGSEHLKIKEIRQIGTENVVFVEGEENTRETLDIVVMVDVASKANDSSLTSHTADKDDASTNSGSQQKFSSKVRPASEMMQKGSKQKVQGNAAQVQRTISSEASNGSAKAKTRKSEGLLMKEKQKMSPRPASSVTHSGRKTLKSEESNMSNPKARLVPPKKSIVKECRSEKTVEAKSSVLEKSLPEAGQTANNRIKQTIGLSKPRLNPGVNQGAAGFTFKSDQRAERRKEGKKTAEMTQSRKSLNFKSTPMPSFYKESAHCSDQNKVISTSMRTPNRPRTPSTMATRTNKFSSNSDTRPTSSSISLTNRNRPLESSKKTYVPETRVQEKKKESSSHKLKQPESIKGPRPRDMLTKNAKIGPKMGCLAVGVAT